MIWFGIHWKVNTRHRCASGFSRSRFLTVEIPGKSCSIKLYFHLGHVMQYVFHSGKNYVGRECKPANSCHIRFISRIKTDRGTDVIAVPRVELLALLRPANQQKVQETKSTQCSSCKLWLRFTTNRNNFTCLPDKKFPVLHNTVIQLVSSVWVCSLQKYMNVC